MNSPTLLLLILRKSVKVLNDYINNGDKKTKKSRINSILDLKYAISKYDYDFYKFIKILSTDFSRFEIENGNVKYSYKDNRHFLTRYVTNSDNKIISTDEVLSTSIDTRWLGQNTSATLLYDNKEKITFVVLEDKTIADNIEIFSKENSAILSLLINSISQAKENEREIEKKIKEFNIEQQRIANEKLKEKQDKVRKNEILSKYR